LFAVIGGRCRIPAAPASDDANEEQAGGPAGGVHMVLSRVGDASLRVRDCEVTLDHSGFLGSRIQRLQRLGRLMHSGCGRFHAILLTREERYERFGKRIEAIAAKGFPVEEVVVPREKATFRTLLKPTLRAKVCGAAKPAARPAGHLRAALERGGLTRRLAAWFARKRSS
jgi:hypothetical protein